MKTLDRVDEVRERLKKQTLQEKERMIAAGMRCISPTQLREEINLLGYKISNDNSFQYLNTGNAITYYARSVSIVEIKTNHCFSNIAADKTNLPALQAIRFNTFCFENGRIWEL